jgi:hypothetical protein
MFEPLEIEDEAVKAFVTAAEALNDSGDAAQAELRYRQALRQAELAHGANSKEARSVASLLYDFYTLAGRLDDAKPLAEKLAEPVQTKRRVLDSKFVRSRVGSSQVVHRGLPSELRKACQILGLSPDFEPTVEDVKAAWKQAIRESAGHPDLGGHTELSILLNTAKDQLVGWLDSKLSKPAKAVDPAPRYY